jgi:hypothetical protein
MFVNFVYLNETNSINWEQVIPLSGFKFLARGVAGLTTAVNFD